MTVEIAKKYDRLKIFNELQNLILIKNIKTNKNKQINFALETTLEKLVANKNLTNTSHIALIKYVMNKMSKNIMKFLLVKPKKNLKAICCNGITIVKMINARINKI